MKMIISKAELVTELQQRLDAGEIGKGVHCDFYPKPPTPMCLTAHTVHASVSPEDWIEWAENKKRGGWSHTASMFLGIDHFTLITIEAENDGGNQKKALAMMIEELSK